MSDTYVRVVASWKKGVVEIMCGSLEIVMEVLKDRNVRSVHMKGVNGL